MTTDRKAVHFPPDAGKLLRPPAGSIALAGRRHNGRFDFPRELRGARTTAKLVIGRSLLTGQELNDGMEEVC